jgi:ABC-type sulfate/molybdate transport systems ATPase subunit
MARLDVEELAKTLGEGSSIEDASAVLRGVSLTVNAGECLGLKGNTGAGKSTLLRIVAGLLRPDAGEVRIDNEVMASRHVHILPQKRGVGLVFQHLGLWPHLTVAGHLEFVLSAWMPSKKERIEYRDELVDTFLLTGLEKRYPSELSGGERHLLALARTFSGNLRVLLLDEPFSGMDGSLKQRILETLHRVRTQRKLTTLLITHDDEEMKTLCDRVEHLSEGRTKNVTILKGQ